MIKYNALLSLVFCIPCLPVMAQEILLEDYKTGIQNSMIELIDISQEQAFSQLDSIREFIDPDTGNGLEDAGILKRLHGTVKTIPLDYNSQVKSFIDKYTSKNYLPYMNKLLGLSNHFFPIYEQVFDEMGLPEEVKYLSVVESSLDPHLVSRSGAVGPWQFMYATAKSYNLDMNNYVDERKDLYISSYAVTQYLKEAHDQFGDWLLALASYNCGRGCVMRAIQRSGIAAPSFWELSPYLPRETQNYIPKYIAMTYVLSNADYYGLVPTETDLDLESKILMVDKQVDLRQVASAINMPLERVRKFNPSYKKGIVNGTPEKPKRLLLPVTENINDSLLYLALNAPSSLSISHDIDNFALANVDEKRYKVKRGESLSTISKKFGVSIQNLRAWNGLSTASSISGRTLFIQKPVNSTLAKNVKAVSSSRAATTTIVYTVKRGDSLDRIANQYKGVTVSKLKADNNLKSSLIKPGMKLKIKKG
ncbi:LysM peptidoglycan-binding domain-containing protein [Sphingobacterium alkalisoli]|uniref:LysM peptidoglycan-binding domain-containing protein n=1 Tax=Sphingobacterium alkalisoli TaxID=1874115 RepID=A0A4V5LYL4_9SPHI|nr:LysM peptidoglycan-binding domain-containing protein [Sphingobacterium alkalisoli]TJY66499.1 LysM peptidoglycan-binding domain-containing protein [Sphingobacterium alkalisoli]